MGVVLVALPTFLGGMRGLTKLFLAILEVINGLNPLNHLSGILHVSHNLIHVLICLRAFVYSIVV